MTFFYEFWKKARVYYTLSISRGGGAQAPGPPPGFATGFVVNLKLLIDVNFFCDKCKFV